MLSGKRAVSQEGKYRAQRQNSDQNNLSKTTVDINVAVHVFLWNRKKKEKLVNRFNMKALAPRKFDKAEAHRRRSEIVKHE